MGEVIQLKDRRDPHLYGTNEPTLYMALASDSR